MATAPSQGYVAIFHFGFLQRCNHLRSDVFQQPSLPPTFAKKKDYGNDI